MADHGGLPNSLEAYWMPFTPNRRFKADPRFVSKAKGMFYYAPDGSEILDAVSGLWAVNCGHAHPRIVEAIRQQAGELDYAPSFNMGHPLAFEFASRVAEIVPGDLDHIFFTNSGSESVDTALKMAIAYHRARGKGTKTRLIGRERGYHGVGFGGISVGGLVKNRMYFGALLAGTDHLQTTHDIARNAFSRGLPPHGVERAEELERLVALHDASNIAAVIVEPVAGSAGVLPPPKGYLERLRAICDRHDILLIFDEVITGFGRLGSPFGADFFGVQPDLMTLAKGITNASVPLGAVAARKHIYDAMLEGADAPIELFHGYTYSGHPLACAAGLATLDVYRDEGLFERAAQMAPIFEDALHSLNGARHVIDIRNVGLMGAVELRPRDGAPTLRAAEAYKKAFDAGVLTRVTGDTLALSPPLIVEESHIGRIVDTLRAVFESVD